MRTLLFLVILGCFAQLNAQTWSTQASGNYMRIDQVDKHLLSLGKGWRLPTVEECIELMQVHKNRNGYYLPDSINIPGGAYVFTGSKKSESHYWVVDFYKGIVSLVDVRNTRFNDYFVLAVKDEF